MRHFLYDSSPVLMTGSILGAMSYRDVEDLLIDCMGREGVELTQQLLTGLRPNPTLEMHEATARVASGAASIEGFLDRFGHRCGNEFELALPRWREDRVLLGLYLAQTDRRNAPSAAPDAESQPATGRPTPQREAKARLNQLQSSWGRVRRDLVHSRLRAAERFFPLREQTKNYMTMEYELLRAPLVELDRRLGLDGGIFYLHSDEIRDAVGGHGVQNTIDARRHEHQLQQGLRLPQVILGHQLFEGPERFLPRDEPAEGVAGEDLVGIGVSPGVVRGRARVLTSLGDPCAVEPGEILVVPSLDPTWTSAYIQAAGLVAERGAVLSHGAILAREFAVPAVVNVPQATSRLCPGEQVDVDGTRGLIRLLGRQGANPSSASAC